MIPQRALVSDVSHLAALDAASFEPRERWSETLWAEELAATDRFVIVQRDPGPREACGDLVAAATFQQVADVVDLHRVMVHPARRGLGLALQLVAAGAEWALARGAERMLLEVRHDNTPALGLYHRLGFERIDRRPDYYGPDAHAEVMQASLPIRSGGNRD